MYKAFVAYEAPAVLATTVEEIDALVVRHHGPVVRRSHPLHVTVMAPRVVSHDQRLQLEGVVTNFNGQYGELPCSLDKMECFDHQRRKHFVVGVKGQKLIEVIGHFHQVLEEELAWVRRPFEGTTPHITLLNSKHAPGRVFDRVVSDARRLALPKAVELPRLCIHFKHGGVVQRKLPKPVEDPEVGWHP